MPSEGPTIMATENNTTKTAETGRTIHDEIAALGYGFDHIPATGRNLMYVPRMMDEDTSNCAGWQAEALESAVHDLLTRGVQDGMDSNHCYLCAFALDAARALRNGVENSKAQAAHDA